MENRTKILVCLCISLALLFTVDCYYRESESPYNETNFQEHFVERFEIDTPTNYCSVGIHEFNNNECGSYYRINYSNGQHSMGLFRVFKEEGIEYKTPVIIAEDGSCKIVIERKGLSDLVYVIP